MAEAEALPPITTLAALREAEIACTRCPLYREAREYDRFVADLRLCAEHLRAAA